jgi:cell division protein FtsI/penicillin-binding protein 2
MRNYQGWKDYQKQLPRKGFSKRFFKGGLWFFPCLLLIVIGMQCFEVNLSTDYFNRSPEIGDSFERKTVETLGVLTKKDLRELIDLEALCNSPDGKIDINSCGKSLSLETTLDLALQSYMLKVIQRSRSPLIGFVAMDPATGRILSVIDSKKVNRAKSVCLSSQFPAASIFKIVSAAAAIDGCNISGDTKLTYNGWAHTLYKNQLTDRINRYTNSISLKTSFAKSINPVFGKLGIFRLKKNLIEEYASRFGFNQEIDFELPVELSRVSVGDDPYHWAEVCCGFNRKTLISPIHGAMMAAAIVNGGKLVEPTIIGYITDQENNPVYVGSKNIIRQVISRKASQEMKELMAATISSGTCSSTFRGYRRDRILSKLSIGGKTGSINDKSDELRYDWFVGYGAEKAGTRKLALSVLVVHDKLLREKAQEFARRAIRYYFKESRG